MTSVAVSRPILPRARPARRWPARLAAAWREARQRRELRRCIMEMDDHMLSDLGVSRAQILFELDRRR